MYRAIPQCRSGHPFPAHRIVGLLLLWAGALPAWSAPADVTQGAFLARPKQDFHKDFQKKAKDCEGRRAWLDACRWHEETLRVERDNPEARAGYQFCLRRLHLIARHSDAVYRQTLHKLDPTQAFAVFEQVVSDLSGAHPDRVSFNHQFQQGLYELRLALDEPLFLQQHLPGVKPAAVAAYKSRLASWPVPRLSSCREVREQARAVIRAAATDGIPLRPPLISVLVMEFVAGACNGIDDYSAFLSPGLVQPPRPGRVGVGIEVTAVAGGIEVARVYKKGPAEEADVQEGDRVLRVAGQPVAHLHPETVAERLRGLPGTTVEVEFGRPVDDQTMGLELRRPIKLTRRAVPMPSVDYRTEYLPGGMLAGYIRISYFGDWTLQEVKEAIAELSKPGGELKGLILDLRGNPGGAFPAAVAIAEMFLTEGVIVIGQSVYKEYNRPFKVETSGPLQMPLVVLVDGETASAAEVLAGALKEGRQGRLPTKVLGQTTYGKGSIQRLIWIEKLLDRPAAIRLTVAKLFSPSNQPYTGRGVTPTHPTPLSLRGFQLLREALKELSALIAEHGPGNMPPMPRLVEMGDADVVS